MKFKTVIMHTCSECEQLINYRPNDMNTALYLCGDTRVCSIRCSKKRLDKIISVDPNIDSPVNWQTISNSSNIMKRSTSQKNLDSTKLVINIPILELIKEEEEWTHDKNIKTHNCDAITVILITMLLGGIIQIFY